MAQMRRLRVFVDANVLFSGIYSETGAPARLMDGLSLAVLTVVVSQEVLDEVARNFAAKAPRLLAHLDFLLTNSVLEIAQDPSPAGVVRWRPYLRLGDATILAAAVSAQPDYFVTGDRHFLDNPVSALESGLRIVTPAQFMELANAP